MRHHILLPAVIVLGLAAALVSFVHRYGAEQRNRRVEIVVDYADAQALANTTRRATDDVLAQLRTAGVTTIAVTEDTPASLFSNGIIATVRRSGNSTLLSFAPGFNAQAERVREMLAHKAPGLPVALLSTEQMRVGAPWPQFSGVPIGLDGTVVQSIVRANLRVAPRLLNYTGVTPDSIAWELAQVKAQIGATNTGPLVFAGAAVLGNRGLVGATADALHTQNLTYGSVELGKMLGDDTLSRRAAAQTVRVHSIGNDEMGTMEEPTAVDRFLLAARERNIRVLYVRLFLSGLDKDPDALHANTAFVGKIVDGLTAAGLSTGAAHPYASDPTPNVALRVLMGLGAAAGGVLLLRVLTGIGGRALLVVFVLSLLAGAVLAVPVKGREILALLAACAFPTLGLCAFALPAPRPLSSTGDALRRAFSAYARMTLSTLAGIVFVVGLLSGRLFLLKVDAFLGVKLVLVAPVLLTAAFYGLGLDTLGPRASWATRRARISHVLHALAAQPLLLGQVVLGLVGLVAFALFVARSGNDPGVGVSGTELKLRALLGKLLLVRPRTKEFLLGHPALVVGLAGAASGRFGRAVLPLIIIGAVGQASLVDTFCHLHTPLFISLLRGVIGWLLGALIGAIAYAALVRAVPAQAAS